MLAPLPLLLALAQAAPSPGPAPAPAPSTVTPAPAPAPAPATPTPLPSAGISDTVAPVAPVTPVPVAPVAAETKPAPREIGPFFTEELPDETRFSGGPQRNDPPRLSIGRGKFCFVDDTACKVSLIATADVGVGVNVVRATDFAFSQFGFRGGLVVKPLTLIQGNGWHPWGLGLAAGWSQGTGSPSTEGGKAIPHTPSFRVFLVNQLWLSQKRNGFHLDIDFGIVRSTIRSVNDKFVPAFGTHASVSANWGGWGGIFLSGDFLYQDTRVVFGFRGHGIAAGPAIGLVLLGLLAGGAFQ